MKKKIDDDDDDDDVEQFAWNELPSQIHGYLYCSSRYIIWIRN
jgi:hypothetical protein